VRWIWLGALLMMLGGFVAATDRRFRSLALSRDAQPAPKPAPEPETAPAAVPLATETT
jgi:cytochrome c-type biogenesis protein CcmF